MLLRSMSPQILAVDELGGKEDFAAVKQALCCGCRVVGTVHAGCVQELLDNRICRHASHRSCSGATY